MAHYKCPEWAIYRKHCKLSDYSVLKISVQKLKERDTTKEKLLQVLDSVMQNAKKNKNL